MEVERVWTDYISISLSTSVLTLSIQFHSQASENVAALDNFESDISSYTGIKWQPAVIFSHGSGLGETDR